MKIVLNPTMYRIHEELDCDMSQYLMNEELPDFVQELVSDVAPAQVNDVCECGSTPTGQPHREDCSEAKPDGAK